MKKNILLLFIILISSNALGQTLTGLTYTIEVEYSRTNNTCPNVVIPPTTTTCDPTSYTWSLKNSSTTLITQNMTTAITNNTYTVPALTSYDLSLSANCYCGAFATCNIVTSEIILQKGYTYKGVTDLVKYGIESGITGSRAGGYSIGPETMICIGTIIVNNFKPNGLSISKINPAIPPEYIAGEQLNLIALTPGPATNRFPDAAYHWQYSLDNKVTWIDVPLSMSNKPNPNFTIGDLLGEDHVNHFGPIDFRLGYSNRPFTNPYRITYKPGTVILKDRTYEAPDCYNDDVKSLIAYFDRKLDSGEVLSILHIVPYPKPNPSTPMLVQPIISALTFDANTGWYKYSFNIPPGTNLENRYYVIEYQSKLNGVPRGTLAIGAPFLYEDPTLVKFEIKQALDPLCNNDSVEIALNVTGGTESYKFYVDGVEKTPTPVKEGDGYYHLRGLNPNAANIIKVTDTKGCIEKAL
jgi:hypothetical protein